MEEEKKHNPHDGQLDLDDAAAFLEALKERGSDPKENADMLLSEAYDLFNKIDATHETGELNKAIQLDEPGQFTSDELQVISKVAESKLHNDCALDKSESGIQTCTNHVKQVILAQRYIDKQVEGLTEKIDQDMKDNRADWIRKFDTLETVKKYRASVEKYESFDKIADLMETYYNKSLDYSKSRYIATLQKDLTQRFICLIGGMYEKEFTKYNNDYSVLLSSRKQEYIDSYVRYITTLNLSNEKIQEYQNTLTTKLNNIKVEFISPEELKKQEEDLKKQKEDLKKQKEELSTFVDNGTTVDALVKHNLQQCVCNVNDYVLNRCHYAYEEFCKSFDRDVSMFYSEKTEQDRTRAEAARAEAAERNRKREEDARAEAAERESWYAAAWRKFKGLFSCKCPSSLNDVHDPRRTHPQ